MKKTLLLISIVTFLFLSACSSENVSDDSSKQEPNVENEVTTNNSDENSSSDKSKSENQILFNINEIANKTTEEVNQMLGEPTNQQKTEFRLSGTDEIIPAIKSTYHDGEFEIMFIEGTAQRITYNPKEEIKVPDFAEELLEKVGLEKTIPDYDNEFTTRWEGIEGFYEVSIMKEEGNVSYLYFIVNEKYQ
jgi:hypothetical protein